jgi:hypothetical protein
MNPLQEKALYHLTGQLENNERAGFSLEKSVSNYPYFAPAQNLLACYYQSLQHPSAQAQAAKATIYHFNPRWWAYQLEESNEVPGDWSSPVFSKVSARDFSPASSEPNSQPILPAVEIPVNPPQSFDVPTIEAVQAILRKIDEGHSGKVEPLPTKKEVPVAAPQASDKLSDMLSSQLQAFRQPVTADTPLPFEQAAPMHTIDYFASQGIKVNWQTAPKDNLTTKLMSFTDWLRQVRQNEKSGIVTHLEKKVAEDAVLSVRHEEVVTEAMADVLLRQGNLEQAIQVLRKLSFQIPEKSSYLAARIEQIKSSL